MPLTSISTRRSGARAVDQCSTLFHVVTGVASNRVGFAHTTCGDLVCRDTFGDQVINNRLSTALGQTPVVSVRTDAVSVTQNNYGTVFRIRVAQLAVQLIQSSLTFRFQGCFVEVEQNVRLQSEVLGLYFRCRSWSRSNYRSCFALTETVGNTRGSADRCPDEYRWCLRHRCCWSTGIPDG